MTAMHADSAMLRAPKTERAQPQKGSTLVEFALVLPLFLVILFGMITFSVALHNKTVLTIAAREGARAGAVFVPDRTQADIINSARAAAEQVLQDNLISFGPDMDPSVAVSISDDILTVTTNVDNYTGIYIFSGIIPDISAETSMKIE